MSTRLRYEVEAATIYNKLKQIKRTGWVRQGVKDPETVYEHTVSLIALADRLKSDLQLSTEELDDLQHILEIHDWAEALVGDEYVPNENCIEYEKLKLTKAHKERLALQALLVDTPYRATVAVLFQRYETGADTISKLAKQLDKYQALELSLTYEREQGLKLFVQFDEYYKRGNSFSHPVIIKLVEDLHKEHAALISTT
jgi:putative hydrolase of HD superfamily